MWVNLLRTINGRRRMIIMQQKQRQLPKRSRIFHQSSRSAVVFQQAPTYTHRYYFDSIHHHHKNHLSENRSQLSTTATTTTKQAANDDAPDRGVHVVVAADDDVSSLSPPTTTTTTISLWDMDADSIDAVTSVDDLESLVRQVEQLDSLTADDLGPLILPLMRIASDQSRVDPAVGAPLTQRLLTTCLRRSLLADSNNHHNNNNIPPPVPRVGMYNRSMIAWGSLRSWQGAQQAQSVWNVLRYEHDCALAQAAEAAEAEASPLDIGNGGERNVIPSSRTSTSGDDDNIISLLKSSSDDPPPAPDRKSYKSLIRAYAISGNDRGPAKAMEYLHELERVSGVDALLSVEEQQQKRNDRNRRAEASHAPTVDWDLLPDVSCYDMVLYAVATTTFTPSPSSSSSSSQQSGAPANDHRHHICWKLARRLDRLHQILANSDWDDSDHGVPSSLAEQFQWTGMTYEGLFRMYETQLKSRSALDCQSKKPTTNEISHIPVELIQLLRRFGVTLDSGRTILHRERFRLARAYGITIESLIASGRTHQAHDLFLFLSGEKMLTGMPVVPNTDELPVPVSIAIRLARAWDAEGRSDRVLQVLHSMATNNTSHARSYELNQTLRAILDNGKDWPTAPKLMESFLSRSIEEQNEPRVNGESFALVMKGWVQIASKESAPRCEVLLDRMQEMFRRTELEKHRPKFVHVELVIEAWMTQTSTGNLARGTHGYQFPASHIESHVGQTRQQSDAFEGSFTEHFVTLAIKAWAKQHIPFTKRDRRLPNPIDQTLGLLDKVKSWTGKSYAARTGNWALQVCSKRFRTSAERRRAFQVGMDIFDGLDDQSNSYSYVLLARLVAAHCKRGMTNETRALLVDAFHDCCQRGLMTQQFVWTLLDLKDDRLVSDIWTISLDDASMLVEVSSSCCYRRRDGKMDGAIEWNDEKQAIPAVLNVNNMPDEWWEHTVPSL